MLNSNKENKHNPSNLKNQKQILNKKQKSKQKNKDHKLSDHPTTTNISNDSTEHRKVKKMTNKTVLKKKQNGMIKNRHSVNEMPLKLDLKRNKNNVRYHSDNLVSFREYCSVEGEWIPLLSGTQRQKLINLMPPTQPSEDTRSNDRNSNLQMISEQKKLQNIFKDLQSNYLTKDQIFSELSELAKQKYSVLLTELLKKIGKNQQDRHTTPVQSPRNIIVSQPNNNNEEMQSSPIKGIVQNFGVEQNPHDQIHRRIQNLVRMREAEQLTVHFDEKQQKIVSGFTTIFEFTQALFAKLCEESLVHKIIANLRIAQGYPKLLKLKSILNQQSTYFSASIIPNEVYDNLVYENDFGGCVEIFSQCIFDALNAELIKLRPYYQTNGQTFPWSFKTPPPITFYQITQETLGIAILEARTKIITNASQLCGILLPEEALDEGSQQKQIVDSYKAKKQMISVKQEIMSSQIQKMMDLQIQNMSTILLVSVSELIMADLCQEIVNYIS